MEFLTKPVEQGGLGRSRHQAEGEVASLLGESPGLDPNRTHDHGTGYGTPLGATRRAGATRTADAPPCSIFAKERGLDPHSVSGQQEFYRHEMLGKYKAASEAIANARTREEALTAHVYKFEKPADKPGSPPPGAGSSVPWNAQCEKVRAHQLPGRTSRLCET
jgi:hypothetical protein